MRNLCSYKQTITNTHIYRSLYKQHACVCGCCHSESCPQQNWSTGWGFGVIDSDDVRTMSSACKPWAPAAQNGKLPAPPPTTCPISLPLFGFFPLPFIPSLLPQHPHFSSSSLSLFLSLPSPSCSLTQATCIRLEGKSQPVQRQ